MKNASSPSPKPTAAKQAKVRPPVKEADALRRTGFTKWFWQAFTTLLDGRKSIMERTTLSKGRVTQLFKEDEPFGEDAAANLERAYNLDVGHFLALGREESARRWPMGRMSQNVTGKTTTSKGMLDVTSLTLAPLISWGRLGEELDKANDLVAGIDKLVTPAGQSGRFKWVVVERDFPAFRIKRGGKIAVEPVDSDQPAQEMELHLFRLSNGSFTIGEYRGLKGGNYEALLGDGPPLDRDRHGICVVALIVGTFR